MIDIFFRYSSIQQVGTYTNRPIDGKPLHSDGVARMDSCAKYDSLHKSSRLGDLCEVLMLIWNEVGTR